MGFWSVVGFIVLAIAIILVLGVITLFIIDSKWFQALVAANHNRKLKKNRAKNPEKYKTLAYVRGYKDMARAVDPEGYRTEVTTFDENAYERARYAGGHYRRYVNRDTYTSTNIVDTTVIDPNTMMPSYPADALRKIALRWIKNDTIFDPTNGQTSREYMVGSEAEYREYYKGGIKFLEDVDNAKVAIFEERDAKAREDRLLESRKKGLAPMNAQFVESYRALEAMRKETYNPVKSWEDQMSELEVK